MIAGQRAGIKGGAQAKFKSGKIAAPERDEILQIVDAAETADFEPLMYLMPYSKVKRLIKRVPVGTRAHPLSEEYIIEELPGYLFDVIEF